LLPEIPLEIQWILAVCALAGPVCRRKSSRIGWLALLLLKPSCAVGEGQ
jgi:hypothetical protein